MKRLMAIALVLLLLFCFTTAYASSPGSAGDPLVSLSYINNTFLPTVISDNKSVVTASIKKIYGDAEKTLQDAYDAYIQRLGGYEGYAYAGAFTALKLPSGASASLVTGSTFILTSGKAALTVEKGTVINISTGSETSASASLTLNQRYFCAEDTKARFTASSEAICLIDGFYQSDGTVIVNPVLFADVRGSDWFNNAVTFANTNNLFKGTSSTTFSPQMSMSRGMFVTVLYRLAGQPSAASDSLFADVPAAQYYYSPVVWANIKTIVTGYSDGLFHPDDLITREQMAVILYRYASFAGYSTAYGNTTVFDSFSDKGSVSAYAGDAVKWAAFNGLLNGSNGMLLPKNTASRAEVAQIVLNFCKNIIGM